MSRVLIAARLSQAKDPDETSRIERDDVNARKWAEEHGHSVRALAADKKVSGRISPFKRKGLGPWLTDPTMVAQWDLLVFSNVDRIGRRETHIAELRGWAEDHGKELYVLPPYGLVWPPPPGDSGMQWRWVAEEIRAEQEWKSTHIRYAEARATIKANGGLHGRAPFGFRVIGPKYSKTLEPNPQLVPYVKEMAKRAIRGDTLFSIAEYLDAHGVLPVRQRPQDDVVIGKLAEGKKGWSPHVVSQCLRMPALKGRHQFRLGETTVHLNHEGVLTAKEWRDLQRALKRGHRGPAKPGASLLKGSLWCALCGGPMYRHITSRTRKDGTIVMQRYYRCMGTDNARTRCRNLVPMADADEWVSSWFAATAYPEIKDRRPTAWLDSGLVGTAAPGWGDLEVIEQHIEKGNDHADEIADIEAEWHSLDLGDPKTLQRAAELQKELLRLKSLPDEPAKITERPTGQTVSELWASLNDEGKRRYLLAIGLKVYCRPVGSEEDAKIGMLFERGTDGPTVRVRPYGRSRHRLWMQDVDPAHTEVTLQRLLAS